MGTGATPGERLEVTRKEIVRDREAWSEIHYYFYYYYFYYYYC